MPTQREVSYNSTTIRDRFGSDDPHKIEAWYFDPDLRAWVFSRHLDVLAAFHNPSLIPGRRDLANVCLVSEEKARHKMREDVRDALCPGKIRAWREELIAHSESLCEQLAVGEPVDLVSAYGRPLCLRFAVMVSGITQDTADSLEELAQIASAATANPDAPALHARAEGANRALRSYFDGDTDPLKDSFIALSQTLLRILTAAWYALIRHPDQWSLLRGSPQSADHAFEELFRYAGVIQVLWRTATEDIDLNGALIRRGDHILLRISAGSHDPEHFHRPEKLDCARRDSHHFAFGAGGHSCVAANLNRMAAVTMTLPLLARFQSAQLARPVEWHGGSVMWSPAALWTILSCT
jgi:cytochrome P450